MKKIGILGGTFNPIHEGHLNIARCARDFLSLDEVWFLPAGTPPHKDVAEHVSAWLRKNMVNAAIASERAFLLCDIELEKKTPCYSWETLEELHAQYGQNADFYFFPLKSSVMTRYCLLRPAERNTIFRGAVDTGRRKCISIGNFIYLDCFRIYEITQNKREVSSWRFSPERKH